MVHFYCSGTPIVRFHFFTKNIVYVTKYYFSCMEYVIHTHERRCVAQQDREQLDQFTMVKYWEAGERERDLYPRPITTQTRELLSIVFLKFY